MKRASFVPLAAAVVAAVPLAGRAQTPAPALSVPDAFTRLFTAPSVQAAWFTPSYLASFPLDKLDAFVSDLKVALGQFASIAPNGPGYTATFANGTVQVAGTLDASGSFATMQISRMQSHAVAERLAALFSTVPIPAAWFSDLFLAQIKIEQLRTVIDGIKTQFGAIPAIAPAKDGTYDLAFIHGHLSAFVYLAGDGKIEGLIFQPKS
jgi:hypothetical protein